MPLAAPGVFTTAILTFFFCWNDFLFAISLTSTNNARTVPFFSGRWSRPVEVGFDVTNAEWKRCAAPAALAFFQGASMFESVVPYVMAASVVVTIPVVILVLAFQPDRRGLNSRSSEGMTHG